MKIEEKEILEILDGMMEHYDKLDIKNYEKGNKSEYGACMYIACRALKRRLQTKFKNMSAKEEKSE